MPAALGAARAGAQACPEGAITITRKGDAMDPVTADFAGAVQRPPLAQRRGR